MPVAGTSTSPVWPRTATSRGRTRSRIPTTSSNARSATSVTRRTSSTRLVDFGSHPVGLHLGDPSTRPGVRAPGLFAPGWLARSPDDPDHDKRPSSPHNGSQYSDEPPIRNESGWDIPMLPVDGHETSRPAAGGDGDRGPGEPRVDHKRDRGRPQRQRPPRGNVHRQPRAGERPRRAAVHAGPLPAVHTVPQRALRLPVPRPRHDVRRRAPTSPGARASPSWSCSTTDGASRDDWRSSSRRSRTPCSGELRPEIPGRQPELAADPLAELHLQLQGGPEHRRRLGVRDRRGLTLVELTTFYNRTNWSASYSFERIALENRSNDLQTNQRLATSCAAARRTRDSRSNRFSLGFSGR